MSVATGIRLSCSLRHVAVEGFIVLVRCGVNYAMPLRDTNASADEPATKRATVRMSVSLPQEDYDVLESVAEANRVSVAWVVRDAVSRYIEGRWPLLRR